MLTRLPVYIILQLGGAGLATAAGACACLHNRTLHATAHVPIHGFWKPLYHAILHAPADLHYYFAMAGFNLQ